MPTPIDILLDPISLAVIAIFAAFARWEAIAPGRTLPQVRGWRLRGLAAFIAYVMVSTYLPLAWTEQLAAWQLFDLKSLGTWGGAAAGLLVYEAVAYFWHRSMHRSDWLWLSVHQMHHSSERLDTYSAFWFSPLDMAGWTAVSSLALTLIVGITAEATTVVLLTVTLLAMFQHTNARTPQWLGYFVQRPESHSYHHARGHHTGNFADLPVFDIAFGTFFNPHAFAPATGFYEGASARLVDMLLWRNVSAPPADEAAAEALRPLGFTHD
jgi:sterol desaturase/sphingolipid hydroxylase (fatty acid hydroxylase superfamily)